MSGVVFQFSKGSIGSLGTILHDDRDVLDVIVQSVVVDVVEDPQLAPVGPQEAVVKGPGRGDPVVHLDFAESPWKIKTKKNNRKTLF